jgi:CRP/FNR family transcriptional regulator, polysaccharide utilization system transcription regulator
MAKKIVLIEDNDDVRENIVEILELSNYEVLAAPNGKEGVRLVKDNIPDLILCDIMMPELDGYGVVKILSSNPATQNIPFIFLSAKSEKEDFRVGMNLGADDYITKPFEDVQLLEAIELRLSKKKTVSNGLFIDNEELDNIESFYSQQKALKAIEQLFCGVSAEDFQKKEMLFSCGSKPRFIYRIEKGNFKTYEINEDGKELITGLYTAGDIMGLSDIFEGNHYTECSKALTKGSYKKVMRNDMLKLIYQNRDVSMYFYRKLAGSVNIRKLRLLHLAYDSVRKRTADSLLWLDDVFNTSKKYPFSINFNRDDLAAMVGTAKESVIRQLTSFKEDKLIDTEVSEIVILNREGLENIFG